MQALSAPSCTEGQAPAIYGDDFPMVTSVYPAVRLCPSQSKGRKRLLANSEAEKCFRCSRSKVAYCGRVLRNIGGVRSM